MAGLRTYFGKFDTVTQSEVDAGEVAIAFQYSGNIITLMPFCQDTPGCCDTRDGEFMRWCVPTGTTEATFYLWGGGGGGGGARCCQQGVPGGSGAFAEKTIAVDAGDCYVVCVGFGGRCSEICQGCRGCCSYILGNRLDCFHAEGGFGGKTCCFAYPRSCCTAVTCPFWYLDNCNQATFNDADKGALGVLGYVYSFTECNTSMCCFKQALPYPGGLNNKQGGHNIMRNQGCACNNEWIHCAASWSGQETSQAVGMGGPSATACGGGCCYGWRGGPGMVKLTYR